MYVFSVRIYYWLCLGLVCFYDLSRKIKETHSDKSVILSQKNAEQFDFITHLIRKKKKKKKN